MVYQFIRTNRLLSFLGLLVLLFIAGNLLAGMSSSAAPVEDNPTVRLLTSPVTGAVGETFASQDFIDTIPAAPVLQAYQISMDLDPAVLSVTTDDVIFGSIWPSGAPFPSRDLTVNSFRFGEIPSGAGSYPSRSNLMATTIEWTGVGVGASPHDVHGTSLVSDQQIGVRHPDVVEVDGAMAVSSEPQSFDCTTVTEIPQAECEELVAFYDATDGDNWNHNNGWKLTNTPCSWSGVSCADGYVYALQSWENGLSGSIPDFANLPNLQYLRLYNNQLSGSIPDFANLPDLEGLWLSSNQLSGSIPDFANLPDLVTLSLDSNQLSGSIPSTLGNLTRLNWLRLNHNDLTGPLPQSLLSLSFRYFHFHDTDLCEPGDTAYQSWLSSIESLERTEMICGNQSISGSVWADSNKNGVWDAEEPGLAGVEIMANTSAQSQKNLAVSGRRTTTDESGGYEFAYIQPGSYSVSASYPPSYWPTTDSVIDVTVPEGAPGVVSAVGFYELQNRIYTPMVTGN
ncbi:MAG: hypothetical protein GY759_20125 [Chloroflexi bacterium]|nr:hypothetical protein [Chloroflexota bacterium]